VKSPTATPTAGQGSGPLESIRKLAELREIGALTDEEFEIQKAKLLDKL
jgi:hypothetical protein